MQTQQEIAIRALDDLKAFDIKAIDVAKITCITDTMIIATGTSSTHVKALADNVIKNAKEQGIKLLSLEGTETGEWVLVDLGDVVVHIMQPRTRDFYHLEGLWELSEQRA
jgi:ribosome-associated protein